MAEEVDIAIGAEATDDSGAWWGFETTALLADGYFAVVAHSDRSLLTKDVGPPGAFRSRSQDRAFFQAGLVPSRFGGGANFSMDFMAIGMEEELLQQGIGAFQFHDFFGGK